MDANWICLLCYLNQDEYCTGVVNSCVCFPVLMLSTAHLVVRSVLFLSVLDANTSTVYSYSISFEYH